MQFGIVSDSSCDLPENYIREEQIKIVSFYISFEDEIYLREGKDISVSGFYHRMSENPESFPKTSMPSVQDYVDAFIGFVKQGIPVLCICLSQKLSGSLQSAVNAKRMVEEQYKDAKIEILDSELATALQGMLVKCAVDMRNSGLSLARTTEELKTIRKTGHIFFTTDDLRYLEHGGRIGKAACVAGTMLKIKPLLQFYNGELGPSELCRGRKKSLVKIADKMSEYVREYVSESDDYYFVTGAGLHIPEYEQFRIFLQERLSSFGYRIHAWEDIQIGAAIGVHTGPYPIGTGILKRWKRE